MRRSLSPKEDVVDLLPDEGPQPQELPVNPMQDGLEEVPLPRVLAVKQLQQLHTERRRLQFSNCLHRHRQSE